MIKYTVKIDPEALNDIQGITIWYNEQQPGLGRRFQTSAVKQINSLKAPIGIQKSGPQKQAGIFKTRLHVMPIFFK
jgi:hypothetical protein